MPQGSWGDGRRASFSGQLLDRLLEHNPAIVYTCTLGRLWTFSYVSPNVRTVLGYEAAEVLGDGSFWLSRIHPADRGALPERAAAGLLADGASLWEYRIRHRDGSYRWLQNEVRLLPDADPLREPFECTGYCIDITQRKNAEAAFKESEARFEAFMKNSPAIAFLKDEDGRLAYANPAFLQRVGLGPGQWHGKTDAELWPIEFAVPIRASDLEVLTTGLPKAVEEIFPTANGPRVFFTLKFPLKEGSGRTLLAGMGIDATERRLLQNHFAGRQSAPAGAATPGAETLSPPFETLPLGNETILLVEDEALVRELAMRLLRQQGYTVLEATNGDEADAALLRHGQVDLVLTDVVMPGIGGRLLVDRLRLRQPNLRVVFMSGYSDASIFDPAEMGPNETFVHKPFSPQDILVAVRAMLDGHNVPSLDAARF
jgi:PAS domain S-box-containing protein